MGRSTPLPAYRYEHAGPTTAQRDEDAIETAILSLLPAGRLRVLELGCGNGRFAARLAKLGHEVTAIDASATGIAVAKKHYGDLARFKVHSVYDDLGNIIRRADVIVAKEVIEHLLTPKVFLRETSRALTRGGRLILSTPYHGYLKNVALSVLNKWDSHHGVDWEGGHVKFFSVRTLDQMIREAGLTDIRFKFAGRVRWLWKSMIASARKP